MSVLITRNGTFRGEKRHFSMQKAALLSSKSTASFSQYQYSADYQLLVNIRHFIVIFFYKIRLFCTVFSTPMRLAVSAKTDSRYSSLVAPQDDVDDPGDVGDADLAVAVDVGSIFLKVGYGLAK